MGLPEGTPPYIENEAPAGTEHTFLEVEARRLYNFAKGGNNTTKQDKKRNFVYTNVRRLYTQVKQKF